MMHVPLGDTYEVLFTTRDFDTGAPQTLGGTPALSVYEEANTTEITSGVSLSADYDTRTGLNQASIVASSGNGYEVGKYYSVVITTGTVDGVSVVGEVVGHFRVMPAEDAGAGIPDVNLTHIGDAANSTSTAQLGVNVVNAAGTAWGSSAITAAALATDAVEEIADQVWDEVLTGATHNVANSAGRRLRNLQDFGVYEGGAIWIDTVSGTAGTTDYENGTVNNPVDSIADALTLAASVGLKNLRFLPGSSITLAASVDNYAFRGHGYTVALGGQSVSGTLFEGATITGNDDGSNTNPTVYRMCNMGTNTLGAHRLDGCRLSGDITLAEAADYYWDQCYSGVAGSGTPAANFESAAETKTLSMRHYSGGIELQNFGTGGGTHTMSLEGHGQFVTNANCAGGTLVVRGAFSKTINGSGLTLTEDARTPDNFGLTGIESDGHVHGDVKEIEGVDATDQINAAVDSALDTAIPGTPTAGSVNDVLKDLDARLPASGTISTLSETEIDNPIKTDTYTLPGQGAPTATPTLEEAIMYLYKAWRNKTEQTSSTYTLYADDTTTADQKAAVSDDGTTFTRGEVATGA